MSQINNNAAAFNASKINDHIVLAAQQRDYSNTNQPRSYNFNSGYNSNQQFVYKHANGQNHYHGYNPKTVPKPTGQERRQFFCDHCKVAGRTIQRCYKIHGYPSGHKLYRGRKMAATVVHNDSAAGFTQELSSSKASTTAPALTSEQYSQLIQLLSKHCSDRDSSTRTGEMGAANFLAGKKYCLFTTHTHKASILNSGASDHITPDLSLFHNVSSTQTPCCITMPNGKQAQIKNTGSMHLASGLILENIPQS